MKPRERERILLVDDDRVLRERLGRALGARGFEVRPAGGYEEAMRLCEAERFDRAVLDLRMPGASGLELLRDMLARWPTTRVLVLTGYGSIATAVEAVRLGAVNYVAKPVDADDLVAAFQKGDGPALAPVEVDYAAPTLARTEWEHIQRVLVDCNHNISLAARRLGIHRRSLQRKLQKYAPD